MIYKVSYDGASWGPGKRYVHIGAIIEVEAESEEEARKKAREILVSEAWELSAGGLVIPVKSQLDSWITRRGRG